VTGSVHNVVPQGNLAENLPGAARACHGLKTMSVPTSDSPASSIEIYLGADRGPDSVEPPADERRRSGRRARALDRLMDRASQPYPPNLALEKVHNVENLLLFVDDDLRETALALSRIEAYLTRTLGVLESRELRREHVRAVAQDGQVLEQVDLLSETLESLRRRLAKLASTMR
jgi:hypothetical protein